MSIQLTTDELRRRTEEFLRYRTDANPNAMPDPSAALSIADCDGPSGTVTFSYETKPWMTNIWGVVHGGVVACLVDTCMGIACGVQAGMITPTISMTVNYARPVPLNATLLVRAHTTRIGSSTGQMSAEVFIPEKPGEVLVTATGAYHVRKAK